MAARSRKAALDNPNAQLAWDRPASDAAGRGLPRRPAAQERLRRRSPTAPPPSSSPPATSPASKVERPAWIRGIDHRVEPIHLGLRDLTVSESTRIAAEKAGVADGPVDVAELHAPFSHQELILREAIGLGDDVDDQPVGRGARPPTR